MKTHVLILVSVLFAVIAGYIAPYEWNVSALLHIGKEISDLHKLPPDLIVLSEGGYDGMQYYQIAREFPFFAADTPPGSYAYQRILLPIIASILSTGEEPLPWVLLAINILSLLTAFLLLLWHTEKPLYAYALALSPAAIIGLHFSLAEPLTIAILTAFLVHYARKKEIDAIAMVLLSLFVLTREVNILFVGALFGLLLLKKEWKHCTALLIPLSIFLLWHGIIFLVFEDIPFLASTGKNSLPFAAILEIVSGKYGYNRYTLSSLALFFLFVLPALIFISQRMQEERKWDVISLLLLFFLGVMIMMPHFIWGSITSIGRVITPVYPLFAIYGIERDTWTSRALCIGLIVLGLATAIGLSISVHAFEMTSLEA